MDKPILDQEEKNGEGADYIYEKPKEGCILPNGRYYFKMLEPEVLAQVTVPFEEIQNPAIVKSSEEKEEAANEIMDSADSQSSNRLKNVLRDFGFAVIPNALSSILEVENMRSLFSQDLLSIISKPHSDPKIYAEIAEDPIKNFPLDKLSLGYMFCSSFGLPHGRLAWYARTHPRIKKIFATIYNDEELCTGMDNLFYSNKPAETPLWEIKIPKEGKAPSTEVSDKENHPALVSSRYGETLWPHVDQNLSCLPEGLWEIYQSALYVAEADENTSATVVWPKSHREVTEKIFETKSYAYGHYCTIPWEYEASFIKNARRVPVPAGGLLIWNSRQVHQGWNCGPRLAVPLCLEPKARRPIDRIEKKKKLIQKGAPSTHWASIFRVHDLGYSHLPRESKDKNLMVLHRAHHFLFGKDSHLKEIPSEILSLL